jgi:two-component system cell cycle response regulator
LRQPPVPLLQDETIRDVAREARTALATLMGYIDLLSEDLVESQPTSIEDLGKMREATRRVEELIELLENHADSARAEANRDPLTGAANRRTLVARGEACFLSESPLSMLLIDVDKFKEVNDQHGHLVGDEVLRILVERSRRASRDTDLVARFAGDEFVILLPGTALPEAERVADRLLKSIVGAPFATSGGTIPVTVSVGVATRDAADASMEAMVRRADGAMYRAKQRGGGRVARL